MIKILQLILMVPFLACSKPTRTPDATLKKELMTKYTKLTKSFSVPTISAKELLKVIDQDDVVLIDVREKKEQTVSIIPQAISIGEFKKKPARFKNMKIIAYCTIGYRSALFAKKHKSMNIYNLIGGVLMWSHLKGPFVDQKGNTTKVHIYSKRWNFLNSNYQPVSK